MPLSSDTEIEEFLSAHDSWERNGDAIERKFELDDFTGAMAFVNRVALAAQRANHHPDIDIRWNEVTLSLSTHSEGGLTNKDLELAAEIEGLA